ncbi:MAG: Asp-tRNA(Asn)/Glu-tRNA(Gln) amidotransferase subunit GatA [Patescibacteria group bacterium]
MNLTALTIKDLGEGLRGRQFSAKEITEAYLKNIEARDKDIGAYLEVRADAAVREAEEVDKLIAADEELSELAGLPLAIKDNILIAGEKTTAASKILANYIASYDAGVIQKLRSAHAVLLGKTNLDEFAMGASTENSGFKITRNPHDLERVPGGSSGGSAAAVAADMALAALGSDTFGSIRQPSSFCGTVGLKPTYGAVSRSGLIAMASSMDQIGPITKTVEDAAILFKAIAGRDSLDATSTEADYENLLVTDTGTLKKMKIGVPKEYFIEGVDSAVKTAVESVVKFFEGAGLTIRPISLPHTKYAVPSYYLSMPAEVSANLARFDGIRYSRIRAAEQRRNDARNNAEEGSQRLSASSPRQSALWDIYLKQRGRGFGPEVKRRIILGTFVLSSGYYDAYYKKAQQARRLISDDFASAFGEVDVIITPVAPTPAFKIGEKADDPLAMYLEDIFTGPVNLAGLPAISVPVRMRINVDNQRRSASLPIGFQLIGKHFREADILSLGNYYELNADGRG